MPECTRPNWLECRAFPSRHPPTFTELYIGGVGVTSMPQVPTLFQAVAIVAGVPIVILIQANTMIGIIKEAYRRRGWMVRLGG